ncbi:MAG: hypothetical protein JRF53_00670 [Deltaproteobacteria bacterium]|nr:hypothetical protein [Deltaproteobacteria bacterium]
MIKEAMEKVVEMATPKLIKVNERSYSSKTIFPVMEPVPAVLTDIHTLTGLTDYLKTNIDKLDMSQLLIHVQGPAHVALCSRLTGDFLSRPHYLTATAECPDFLYDHYYSVEMFIIKLQAIFLPTELQRQLLSIVGNLKDSNTTKFKDDGVTQEVTVKAGITRVEETEIPNPIVLQPYRTFFEIGQPESLFVFRLKTGPNGSPLCALFEADGGAWRLKAIERIRDWIKKMVPEVAIIA